MADNYDVRAQLLETLMGKVADERFPSATTLDMIEELLTPDDVPRYAEMLLEHVRTDTFPSIAMMARLKGLV